MTFIYVYCVPSFCFLILEWLITQNGHEVLLPQSLGRRGRILIEKLLQAGIPLFNECSEWEFNNEA